MAGWMPINRCCLVVCIHFNFAHIRAYAIRPYTCSIVFWGLLGCMLFPFPPTWGRIAYALTLVRLISGFYCVAWWFHFRPHQGVCDTPLHLFGWFPGFIWLGDDFIFAHIRAYAIRPYTCSIDFRDLLGCVLISISLTSGRMRYAPTHVRLIFGIYWVGCWFHFRPHQGVCDTPLLFSFVLYLMSVERPN